MVLSFDSVKAETHLDLEYFIQLLLETSQNIMIKITRSSKGRIDIFDSICSSDDNHFSSVIQTVDKSKQSGND